MGYLRRRWIVRAFAFPAVAVIAFWQPTARANDDPDLDELQQQWTSAYEAGDVDRAIEIGLRLNARDPENSTHAYNLATAYAQRGDVDDAVRWLNQCAEKGFPHYYVVRMDTDLARIRRHPGYRKALDRIRSNHFKELAAFKPIAEQTEPVVVLPPQHDPNVPAPLIIVLHGYSDDPVNFAAAWRTVAARFGAILMAPRSVRPAGEGFHWGNLDEADLILTHSVEYVQQRYPIDKKRMVLAGYSQGGFMALCLGLRHADWFAGLIPMGARYDTRFAPVRAAKSAGLPRVYLMVGELDQAAHDNRRAARDLLEAGASVELRVFEDRGHEFPDDHERELEKAIAFVLDAPRGSR